MAEVKAKYFTIIAGNYEPQPQLQGFLQKTNGQPQPNAVEIMMTVGIIQIPNYSSVWGKRVLRNPTEAQKQKYGDGGVSLTDPDYKGDIEFLKYGTAGGEAIEVRYLLNSSTLDKQFQDNIQKLKPRDEDAFIELTQGVNDYDYATQATLIQMLKVHGRNSDSISRNPAIDDSDFREYDAGKILIKEKDKIQELNTALNIVFATEAKDGEIAVLATIIGADSGQQTEMLFNALLDKARNDPKEFLRLYTEFKKKTVKLLGDSVEMKLLDITQDGVLSFYENNKKEILLSSIGSEYKGRGMFLYITDNILNPEVFKAVGRLKAQFEKSMQNV